MASILDPKFRYTPAAATDIRRTFARVRREIAEQERRRAEQAERTSRQVTPLNQRRK